MFWNQTFTITGIIFRNGLNNCSVEYQLHICPLLLNYKNNNNNNNNNKNKNNNNINNNNN